MKTQLISDSRTKYPQIKRGKFRFEGISARDSSVSCPGYTAMHSLGTYDLDHGIVGPIESKEVQTMYIFGKLGSSSQVINPLPIRVTYDGNEILCEIPTLEIYSFSNSISDGISELIEEIEDLYLVLNSTEKLGSEPKKWKRFIDQYIHFESNEL